jgi:Cu(I)/Ag(I) efflux system membrane fusion protein
MSLTLSRPILIGSAAALLLIGLGAGYFWFRPFGAMAESAMSTGEADKQAMYWYDPMVPDQHFDKPGKSPFMDMQLVPKYADAQAASGVRIDAMAQQNVGIRTSVVSVGSLQTQLRVPGTLTWDLRQESVVSARVDSIVSQLNVKAPYESVKRGQPLATVLAPMWSSALAEARALDQAQSSEARSLRSAAQQRLRTLGLSGQGGGSDGSIVLRSPSDGVVSEVMVREGQLATAGMPLFRVNGIATLWLEAAIPQASTAGITRGTKVSATVSALPGRTFDGEVEALLPQIDANSRTQRARIVLNNTEGVLVPGMFAELTLRADPRAQVPLIPTEALVATGSDSRVIVVAADGSFEPVHVQIGRSAGGKTEILSGLKGGERIVTSGQFLIDSEASLSGALDRLTMAKPEPMAPADSMAPTTSAPDDAMSGMAMDAAPPAKDDKQ